MRLLIKQRVFSWTDSYDVYDENEIPKYFVKSEFFSLGHQIYVYNKNQNLIGSIHQKLLCFFPTFEIKIDSTTVGQIQKKFSLLNPKYEIDFNGWSVNGDFWGWDYDVSSNGISIMHISKEPFHWGDTYVLNFDNSENEIMGLLLVIAIDAANCTNSD